MFGEAPRDWISKVYVSEALSGDAELMAQVEKLPYRNSKQILFFD